MYDDDLFSMLNSYTATEKEEDSSYDSQTSVNQNYQPYQSNPYIDDYSTAQNYEEEKSYNSQISSNQFEEPKTNIAREMHKPTIVQQAPAVNLIKKKEKIYISARLKAAATVFFIIFASLIFATVWNFAQAGKMQTMFASKQAEINELSQSINELTIKYNELNDPNLNIDGYVQKVDGVNSFTLSLDDFYTEPEVELVDSNWFNDVCEFFRNIFV